MATIVLNSEESSFFSKTPLRRSHSQPRIINQTYSHPSARPKSQSRFHDPTTSPDASSIFSSPPSSPNTYDQALSFNSLSSTAASSLSLGHDDEDQLEFPSYEDDVPFEKHGKQGIYYKQLENLEPPLSPPLASSTVSNSNSVSPLPSRPQTPELVEPPKDDTAVRRQPSRHVDYLSHNWKEEDIWLSWKHIVSKRGHYCNSARLENASWRTWIKSKNKLKTVSPETLNWLKDCDVTWLYGPLQTRTDKAFVRQSASPSSSMCISKNNSFISKASKKPILKKRSMSEIMLQRSLSASSLLKQAAAAVQAQQSGSATHPGITRASSDYVPYHFTTRRGSREDSTASVLTSVTSSGMHSPFGERKHISFNEQVEQCIALDMKGEDDDDVDVLANNDYDDSDSDDGAIMMKSTSNRKMPPMRSRQTTPRASFCAESKTIAMLPSTTLKYRGDTPEPDESTLKPSSNGFWGNSKLSTSLSQETLRPSPSQPSAGFLLGEDEDDDIDLDWQPAGNFAHRKDSMSVTQDRYQSPETASDNGEPSGMRRTPSGMFMPYEEDEDDIVSEGLFGRVVDTVNTAKDIAHVIWNVGWRR